MILKRSSAEVVIETIRWFACSLFLSPASSISLIPANVSPPEAPHQGRLYSLHLYTSFCRDPAIVDSKSDYLGTVYRKDILQLTIRCLNLNPCLAFPHRVPETSFFGRLIVLIADEMLTERQMIEDRQAN